MSASDYDDTGLTLEDLRLIARNAVPTEVTNLGGRTLVGPAPSTTSSNTTQFETIRLAGHRDQTIRETLEFVGT